MTVEQLDALEQKVTRAIQLIEELRVENSALKDEVKQLTSEVSLRDSLVLQLREENHDLGRLQEEAMLGKDKEARIRSRVEQMLAKLDELQYL